MLIFMDKNELIYQLIKMLVLIAFILYLIYLFYVLSIFYTVYTIIVVINDDKYSPKIANKALYKQY
jgi:hypothetical protein